MTTTIAPEELFFGSPTSITYGGTEVGATIDPPKVTITPTLYKPEFQNAIGPVRGAVFVTAVEASVELTVNQITAEKLAWALPGAEVAVDVLSWPPGRVHSSAFKDLTLVGERRDGRQHPGLNSFHAASLIRQYCTARNHLSMVRSLRPLLRP